LIRNFLHNVDMPTPVLDPAARTRIERLNRISTRSLLDPDAAPAADPLRGHLGDGQVIADELLTIADLPELATLNAQQRRLLSRLEVASTVELGIRFEAILMAGLALEVAGYDDLADPAAVYALHEIGEETRHSRLFSRLLAQLDRAPNPLRRFDRIQAWGVRKILRRPALFYVLVLAGEEIPDLVQKHSADHCDTDPFLRAVNRYHRAEEARHLAYARTMLPQRWASVSPMERLAVRHLSPLLVKVMFDSLVHPGVYRAVGLPSWSTWKRTQHSPRRVALRHAAARPILASLIEVGVFPRGHVTRAWQQVAGVDRTGQPIDDTA
jgi:hypothetical protein